MSSSAPSIANAASPGSPGGTQTAPYAVRQINVTLTLGKGSFGSTGSSEITISSAPGAIVGPRVLAHVEFANGPSTGMLQCRIWGMTLSDMNAASKAGLVYDGRNNTITVQAGDAISGMTTVFTGIIIEAYPDLKSQPDTSFFIQASPTLIAQLKPVPPASYPGAIPVATALSQMAKVAGWGFQNNGVATVLQSPYFHGTVWSQILSAVRAADCFFTFDHVANVLAIWPKTGSRSGGPIQISAATGMIGYPEFQALQIRVRTLFNTQVAPVGPGRLIQVYAQATDATGKVTPLSAANGEFIVISVTHDLAAQIPKGPWTSTILATPVQAAGSTAT